MKLHLQTIFTLCLVLFSFNTIHSQCNVGEVEVIVSITPDNYPNEISWNIKDASNVIVANGLAAGATICLPDNVCYTFTILDSYGVNLLCLWSRKLYSNFKW